MIKNTADKMSAVCMSFLGIIVLIARECACEWQGDFGDGNESVFTARRNASAVYAMALCQYVCVLLKRLNIR